MVRYASHNQERGIAASPLLETSPWQSQFSNTVSVWKDLLNVFLNSRGNPCNIGKSVGQALWWAGVSEPGVPPLIDTTLKSDLSHTVYTHLVLRGQSAAASGREAVHRPVSCHYPRVGRSSGCHGTQEVNMAHLQSLHRLLDLFRSLQ